MGAPLTLVDGDHDASVCLVCVYGYAPAYRPHTFAPECWCMDPARRRNLPPYVCHMTQQFGVTVEDLKH